MKNLSITLMTCSLAGAVFAATAPKNIFVSTDPGWKMPGLEGETYTDLVTAVGKVDTGDTLYIQDGFNCTSGNMGSSCGQVRIKLPNKVFTFRSESGYVDLAAGKGAAISGCKDPASTYEDGRGDNAYRPLQVQNANTVVQGLILQNGSTADAANGVGGGALGPGIYTNCLFRNNYASNGGALKNANAKVYNCVFTNNYAFQTYYGGGAIANVKECYDSLFVDNGAAKQGGAVFSQWDESQMYYFSNCTFKANWSKEMGGAFCLQKGGAYLYDCKFIGNTAVGIGGGGLGPIVASNCVFACNSALEGAGFTGNNGTTKLATFIDCVVTNNRATASGGGLRWAKAVRTTIANNLVCRENNATVVGGGAYVAYLDRCTVTGNIVSNLFASGNSTCGGGGLYQGAATNCLFAGNVVHTGPSQTAPLGGGACDADLYSCVISNNFCTGRGSGVFGSGKSMYNCLVVDNYSTLEGGYHWIGAVAGGDWKSLSQTMNCYNCTIVGNRLKTPSRHPGACRASLFNCILDDNGDDPLCEIYIASNCCCNITDDGVRAARSLDNATYHYGNLNTVDPHLTADYHLARIRPCADIAEEYDWMTAEGDVRAMDLDGRPRILGKGPDMGCYERKPLGLSLFVR